MSTSPLFETPATRPVRERALEPCILCKQPTSGSATFYRDPRAGRHGELTPSVRVPACPQCCAREGVLPMFRAYLASLGRPDGRHANSDRVRSSAATPRRRRGSGRPGREARRTLFTTGGR